MSLVAKSLTLSLSIAALLAADKNARKDGFRVNPASSYAARQTNEKVTIAVELFDTPEKVRSAFGKVNPNEYGVLPVLLVMQNDSPKALDLHHMRVEYIAPDRQRIDATPASDVRYLRGVERPPAPGGEPRTRFPIPAARGKRNPLDTWEIDGRAFAARMLPPGESAYGFFYFQVRHRPEAKIYITGVREAGTQRELWYFEIPLP